ncbi:repeat protein, partial [Gemelliphila asaccharolytica]
MTLYYGQTIPNLFEKPAPTKEGATFDGWRLNQDITIKDGNTEKKLSKGTIIKEDEYPDGLKNAMPFENISLSAVWKEKEKSSYAIQFWTQKAESDGYDYVGFKEVKDVKTGTIPNLDEMMPDGIKFPEISEDLTKKDRQEELKKYYVRNVEKTKKENLILTDDTNGKKEYKIKRVDSTGNTTYNIYYDRQTYTILFEKSNKSADKPEIKMDIPNVGKFNSEKSVNKPYKITVKFGERLKGWPHDEWLLVNSEDGDMDEDSDEYKEQLKTKTEFPIGEFMLGWTFNTDPAAQYSYRDTPPYWMTSKDFIDPYLSYTDDKNKQQLAKKVTNSVSTGEKLPERTISVGPDSNSKGKVYYVEFSMQGLPKDENDTSVPKLKFNPALAYWKTDTSSSDYKYTIPEIPGFKKQEDKVYPEGSYDFDDLKDKINDEFNERNPDERPLFNYAPKNINGNEIENSGYIVAKYDREKYKITLNTDPRDKNKTEEYGDVYYDMPLRKLHLDDKKIPAKPNDLPSNYVFKGWATDPKGFNLIKDENKKANEIEEEIKEAYKNIPDEYIENDDGTEENDDPNLKKESNAKKYKFKANIEKLNSKLDGAEHRMPNYNLTVYAIWGAPDKVFDISFDLNDDNNSPAEWQINPEDLASYADGEKIQTSIGYKPYYKPEFDAKRSTNNKKIFTINNALSIKTPQNIPKRKGHDFLGWELLTDNQTEDEGYRKKYGVPRLYSFGNEVISNIHLRAIWNKNSLEDVKVTHHLLSEDYKKDEQKETILENQRSNVNATAYGQMQGEEHILLEEEEFQSLDKDNRAKKLYEEYKQKTNQKNSYYQNLTVKKHDEAKEENFDNHFHFFYRPYRYRTYNVNYILLPNDYDKDKLNKTSNPYYQNKILTAKIKNGNRHFDAIDYEKIPGYKLVSDPQVQLFFEVDENSHKLIGMNGHNEAGFDQVNFYYKDMRIIKRKSANDKTPNGYHRVTFKANEGGNFGNDEKGKEIKEISYDVINGLHFDKINLPAPQGEDNYIFNKWENEALLKGKDEISKDYTFNATFKKVDDVIEVTDNSNQDIPKNYVDV